MSPAWPGRNAQATGGLRPWGFCPGHTDWNPELGTTPRGRVRSRRRRDSRVCWRDEGPSGRLGYVVVNAEAPHPPYGHPLPAGEGDKENLNKIAGHAYL